MLNRSPCHNLNSNAYFVMHIDALHPSLRGRTVRLCLRPDRMLWSAGKAVLCVCFAGVGPSAAERIDSPTTEKAADDIRQVGATTSGWSSEIAEEVESESNKALSEEPGTSVNPTSVEKSDSPSETEVKDTTSPTGGDGTESALGTEVAEAEDAVLRRTSPVWQDTGTVAETRGPEKTARETEEEADGEVEPVRPRCAGGGVSDTGGRVPANGQDPGTQEVASGTTGKDADGRLASTVAATSVTTGSSATGTTTTTSATIATTTTITTTTSATIGTTAATATVPAQPAGVRRSSCGDAGRSRPGLRPPVVTPGMLYRRACGQGSAATAAVAARCSCARTPDGTVVHYRCHVQQAFLRQRGECRVPADTAAGGRERGGMVQGLGVGRGTGSCMCLILCSRWGI